MESKPKTTPVNHTTGEQPFFSQEQDVPQPESDHNYNYKILTDPLERMRYVSLTSELINHVLKNQTENLIFLDKSARPVYWLMRELWPLLASSHDINDEQPHTPPMPKVNFLNIDRGIWIKKTGSFEDDTGPGVRVDRSTVGRDIANLRAAFMANRHDVGLHGEEFDHPGLLDGKRIMIVDEVRVSGNTLEIAKQFVQKAFPSSSVIAEHWMHPMIDEDKVGNRFNSDIPVWYSDKTALGRGIGDLNQAGSEQSRHERVRRGNKFFSRPLRIRDQSSINLRNDIRMLVPEIVAGDLPLRFNLDNLDETTIEQRLQFMEAVNGVSARELTQIIQQADGKAEKFLRLFHQKKQLAHNSNKTS